jgi:hypothetical protein
LATRRRRQTARVALVRVGLLEQQGVDEIGGALRAATLASGSVGPAPHAALAISDVPIPASSMQRRR